MKAAGRSEWEARCKHKKSASCPFCRDFFGYAELIATPHRFF